MERKDAIELAFSPAPVKPVLRPFRNRVLVLMVEADSQIGSILVPDGSKVVTGEAIVVDVGDGIFNVVDEKFVAIPDLQVGDRVQMAKYLGTAIGEVVTLELEDENGPYTKQRALNWVVITPDNILGKYE